MGKIKGFLLGTYIGQTVLFVVGGTVCSILIWALIPTIDKTPEYFAYFLLGGFIVGFGTQLWFIGGPAGSDGDMLFRGNRVVVKLGPNDPQGKGDRRIKFFGEVRINNKQARTLDIQVIQYIFVGRGSKRDRTINTYTAVPYSAVYYPCIVRFLLSGFSKLWYRD